ncbi:NB-ARC domain-containing protein [Streptomyces sp. NPDC053493]|uniref:NB-ARC domain-containing protein n=1 Tax=Streptomyces sp. NPDC053493 TaxID=3365705 RepID=UPI0037D7A5CF
MDEFIGQLRMLKAWAGHPSITEITRRVHTTWRRAGRPRSEWPARSTVGNCFQVGRRRPNTDLLLAVVHALVDGDTAALSVWRQALRTVLGEVEASGRVTAYDRLPPAPSPLVGRDDLQELAQAWLRAQGAEGVSPVVAFEGMAGTGKTALAVAVAHRLRTKGRSERPVLFAHLRGAGAGEPPVDPSAVLECFLRLLGVAGERIPHSLDARVQLYRQTLAGTSTLVVLDDAADEEQALPLLPEAPTCRAVITSRSALPCLKEARRLPVSSLDTDGAVELLHRTAGRERFAPDASAARRIAGLLGHHPQALTIIGRHLRDHPNWDLADYYRESLTVLAMEGGVRASLAASDTSLPAGARRLLRLLALPPLDDLDTRAIAALADESADRVRTHLRALVAAHLVQEVAPDRYRLPDLVHAYAEERLSIDEPASRIRQALGRVLAHYRTRDDGPGRNRPGRPGGATARTRFPHADAWEEITRPLTRETAGSAAA